MIPNLPRRALLAGAGAVVGLAGVSAQAAAGTHPDAALFAAINRLREHRLNRPSFAMLPARDEDAANEAWAARDDALIDALAETEATTPAGLLAKAAVAISICLTLDEEFCSLTVEESNLLVSLNDALGDPLEGSAGERRA